VNPYHAKIKQVLTHPPARSLVLIGMMGAGKTSIGRRLAKRLGLTFRDADHEIEAAAGMSVEDIFAQHGEAAFRDGERKVIARLLREGAPQVLATGGGAFMNAETRARIEESGISIWLKADLDVLMERVSRRGHRPLLKTADPRATMQHLLAEREPHYAHADITVKTGASPHDRVVGNVVGKLAKHLKHAEGPDAG